MQPSPCRSDLSTPGERVVHTKFGQGVVIEAPNLTTILGGKSPEGAQYHSPVQRPVYEAIKENGSAEGAQQPH